MKIFTTVSFLFFAWFGIHAQSESAVFQFQEETTPSVWRSQLYEVSLDKIEPFLATSVFWAPETTELRIRFSTDGLRWEAWEDLSADPHANPEAGEKISRLLFTNQDGKFFQLEGNGLIEKLYINFFSPGKTPETGTPTQPVSDRSCPCPQPEYLDREQWCPSGDCPKDATPSATNVSHLIIHHSASSNVSSDWAAVVRSIWNFHTAPPPAGNGWDDIGYNWLVDPNGVIYEGRGDNILGAHFCGTNGSTMGVCMIGTYTSISPTNETLSSIADLLAWKACDEQVDPLGTAFHPSSGLNLNYISGHRDGCPTACPGDAFYPLLPNVRQSVHTLIEDDCNNSGLAGPGSLEATATALDQIELNWVDNSNNEEGFLLERSKVISTNFQQIDSLPANTTTYLDTGLQSDRKYYYRLRAVTATDTSSYSNEAFATTLTTSTNEFFNPNTVNLFPNPAKNHVMVSIENELRGTVELSIFDVLSRQLVNSIELDKQEEQISYQFLMENLPAGTYNLLIKHSKAQGSIRFIKI